MTRREFGDLLDSVRALSPEQMLQLRRELNSKLADPALTHGHDRTDEEQTDQELQRRLFEAGLLSEIRPPVRIATGTERFTPITISGEPLSETVIHERR